MRILVVTPTLGESPWLAETVASVAAQRLDLRHVLVAPAGRGAGLAAKFPGTRVVTEANAAGGMYAAINAGLAAEREWGVFTYLNDDDLLLPAFAQAAAVADFTGARVVYGGVRLLGADGRRLGAIPISPAPTLNRLLYAQRLEPVYQHGTLVTRAVVEAMGPFDGGLRFCGDSEFLARACVRGVPFVCATRREVAAFRLRAGQLTKNRGAMTAERAQVDAALGLLATRRTFRHRWARLIFRLSNLPVYAERAARHGFLTFDELIARAG